MFAAIITVCLGLAAAGETSAGLAPLAFHDAMNAFSPGIKWEEKSRTRVSASDIHMASYPRLTELRDGALLCVYEGDGSIFATRSTDRGKTWGKAVPVAWHQDGINMAAPEVLQLQDGSILACYNPRPFIISGTRNFGIRTRKSYDGGHTWIHGRLIYEGRHKFTDGCWEPAPVQMPDGEIRVFFANEADFEDEDHNDQNISMLRSRDGGMTWTDKPEIISYKQRGRDGMPVPLLLENGELVCAIEQSTPQDKLQPALLRLSGLEVGSQVPFETIGAHSPDRKEPLSWWLTPHTYAGAPYICQLPTGETLLSYQGTEGRRSNRMHDATLKVWVGDSRGRRFAGCTEPFDIPTRRAALWSSLAVLHDGTIIALTSTNAYAGKWEIWMIKGKLVHATMSLLLP